MRIVYILMIDFLVLNAPKLLRLWAIAKFMKYLIQMKEEDFSVTSVVIHTKAQRL